MLLPIELSRTIFVDIMKKFPILFLGMFPLFLITHPAQALTGSLNLAPGDFTNNTSIASNSIIDNNASATATIDETDTPEGFGNAFSSTFLLLGANVNDSIPTDSQTTDNSSAISEEFLISDTNISNGFLNIKFNWAFQGDATGEDVNQDNFNIYLIDSAQLNGTAASILSINSPGGYGSDTEDLDVNISALTAGNYRLRIDLNENTGPTSSAAGFNNISVSEVAAVPFEFSPTQGLLMVGAFFGLSSYLKHRKTASKLEISD
jgi:hypothetical protein